MNMDKWNSLPKDVQKVMEDLGTEQAEWTGMYMDRIAQESITWSEANQGVEFIQPSDKAEWNKKLQPIVDGWIAKKEKEGVPAKQIVADIRALIKKYSD